MLLSGSKLDSLPMEASGPCEVLIFRFILFRLGVEWGLSLGCACFT